MWYGPKYCEIANQTLGKSSTPRDPQSAQALRNHTSPTASLSPVNLMLQADGEDPIISKLLGTCILI